MISINITYYNEPHFIKWWYQFHNKLLDNGCEFMLNIGDDGSQRSPATAFFEKNPPNKFMRLFRVKEDIGFNSHGVRNLLMKETTTDWNIMTDIDRHYPLDTMTSIHDKEYTLQRRKYYSFWEIIKSSPDRFSVNEYIVHRKDFWKTGGYDEEFVNIHFGDRFFLDTLRRVAKRQKMKEWQVKYVRGARQVIWSDEATKTDYPDDKTLIHPLHTWGDQEKRFALKEFVQQRNKTPEGRAAKKVINFDWERVF